MDRCGGGLDLVADEEPETARAGIDRVAGHRIQTAGGFAARGDPAGTGERLEVAADRRLRQLEDAAERGHRQLTALEQQQNAAPRRIGERGEAIENGCAFHPSSRMKG